MEENLKIGISENLLGSVTTLKDINRLVLKALPLKYSSFRLSRALHLHLLCFISNAYKQRFYPLVKFLKKLSNTTSLFQITKQHYQKKIKQQKLVDLNFCLSNS